MSRGGDRWTDKWTENVLEAIEDKLTSKGLPCLSVKARDSALMSISAQSALSFWEVCVRLDQPRNTRQQALTGVLLLRAKWSLIGH